MTPPIKCAKTNEYIPMRISAPYPAMLPKINAYTSRELNKTAHPSSGGNGRRLRSAYIQIKNTRLLRRSMS